MTVLFADLKGSIELLADRDPQGTRISERDAVLEQVWALEAGPSALAALVWFGGPVGG